MGVVLGEKAARVNTGLSVKQCGDLFRAAPPRLMSGAAKVQGIAAKIAGGVFTAKTFTPENLGSFATWGDDPPILSIGTFIRNGLSAPNPTELHMYVWDRGANRNVVIVASHGFVTGALHARKIVNSLAEMFRMQDGHAVVTLDL